MTRSAENARISQEQEEAHDAFSRDESFIPLSSSPLSSPEDSERESTHIPSIDYSTISTVPETVAPSESARISSTHPTPHPRAHLYRAARPKGTLALSEILSNDPSLEINNGTLQYIPAVEMHPFLSMDLSDLKATVQGIEANQETHPRQNVLDPTVSETFFYWNFKDYHWIVVFVQLDETSKGSIRFMDPNPMYISPQEKERLTLVARLVGPQFFHPTFDISNGTTNYIDNWGGNSCGPYCIAQATRIVQNQLYIVNSGVIEDSKAMELRNAHAGLFWAALNGHPAWTVTSQRTIQRPRTTAQSETERSGSHVPLC